MPIARQNDNNCLYISNKLSMQLNHLRFAWVRIIKHSILRQQDKVLLPVLALMREQASLLFSSTAFFQETLKARCVDKLFNLRLVLQEMQQTGTSKSCLLLASINPLISGQSWYTKHMFSLFIFSLIACQLEF
jgi:hypothetical protein